MRPIQAKTIYVKCAYLRHFSSFKAFHPARLGKIVCEIFFWCIGVNGIKCCTTLWNVFSQRHFHCVGRLEKVHSRFLLFSSISSFLKLLPTSSWIAFPPFSSHFLICNPCALSQLICRVTIFQRKSRVIIRGFKKPVFLLPSWKGNWCEIKINQENRLYRKETIVYSNVSKIRRIQL